jgi:DNA-binding response OmpR family regulator
MAALVVADADRNFREAIAIALRLDGFQVVAAESAEDALTRIAEGGISGCVLDAHLAGAESLLASARGARLRVVLVGPYPDILERLARRHPGTEIVPKPLAVGELAARFARADAGDRGAEAGP